MPGDGACCFTRISDRPRRASQARCVPCARAAYPGRTVPRGGGTCRTAASSRRAHRLAKTSRHPARHRRTQHSAARRTRRGQAMTRDARAKEKLMRKTAQIVLTCCVLILVPSLGGKVLAQESAKPQETAKTPEPPAHFYHLEFVVQETGADGKPTNSRTYSGTVSTSRTDRGFSTRTGSRVPIATGAFGQGDSKNTQFQYIDVGVNIDARDARDEADKLALSLIVDVSSLAGTQNISGVN